MQDSHSCDPGSIPGRRMVQELLFGAEKLGRSVCCFEQSLYTHGYRVRQVVVTWVKLILIRDVPIPISFCLVNLMFGRIGW